MYVNQLLKAMSIYLITMIKMAEVSRLIVLGDKATWYDCYRKHCEKVEYWSFVWGLYIAFTDYTEPFGGAKGSDRQMTGILSEKYLLNTHAHSPYIPTCQDRHSGNYKSVTLCSRRRKNKYNVSDKCPSSKRNLINYSKAAWQRISSYLSALILPFLAERFFVMVNKWIRYVW